MSAQHANETKSVQNRRTPWLIIIPIIVIIAAAALVYVVLLSPPSLGGSQRGIQNMVRAKVNLTPTTNRNTITMKFMELKGVRSAIPLTYPQPDGTLFIYVTTLKGSREIWTFKGTKLIGKFTLNTTKVYPIYDPRRGEYAVKDDKLLLGLGNKIYEIYGNKATPIASLKNIKAQKYGFFYLKGNVYVWGVNIFNSTAICTLYNALNSKVLRNITVNINMSNITRINALPDLLDGRGCLVMWTIRAIPNLYFHYKGVDGEKEGVLKVMEMRIATFIPTFLEYAPYKSDPYFVMVALANLKSLQFHQAKSMFKLKIWNLIQNKTVTYDINGLYNYIGVGDFSGKGYVGDVLFLVRARNGIEIAYYDPNGNSNVINVGNLQRNIALLQGLELSPVRRLIFGLGNYTNSTVVIKSNAGTFKFRIENVPQKLSSLYVLATLDGNKVCYTSLINPAVGGLLRTQTLLKGKVYLAAGCTKR